jgi:hypothetical protein
MQAELAYNFNQTIFSKRCAVTAQRAQNLYAGQKSHKKISMRPTTRANPEYVTFVKKLSLALRKITVPEDLN